MTIERIREALFAEGWGPRPYDDDGYTYSTPTGRITLYVYDIGDQWTASVAGQTTAGPDPLTALRRLYARSDSRRLRAALRPALMELREPEAEREEYVMGLCQRLGPQITPSSGAIAWGSKWAGYSEALEDFGLDAADFALLTLDLAGDPPDEIYDAVTALRARLEEMG